MFPWVFFLHFLPWISCYFASLQLFCFSFASIVKSFLFLLISTRGILQTFVEYVARSGFIMAF